MPEEPKKPEIYEPKPDEVRTTFAEQLKEMEEKLANLPKSERFVMVKEPKEKE